MAKMTVDDLRKLREKNRLDLRRREISGKDSQIIVGMGTCGIAAGAKSIMDLFFKNLDEKKLLDRVLVRQLGCMGYCESEPTVEVASPGMPLVIYGKVDEKTVNEIITKHIIGQELLEEKIIARPVLEGEK